jgi:hypothetical protein
MPDASPSSSDLGARLEALGKDIGAREASHREGRERALACAETLRALVSEALDRFHRAAGEAGAPHLQIAVSEIRTDDKHLRSVEFDLSRGRYRAIVTAKSRGDVTLVGPFRQGKAEGPCRTFPQDATSELCEALGGFLERFLEEAAAP